MLKGGLRMRLSLILLKEMGGKREPGNEAIFFIQVLLYLWCVVYNCHSTVCNSSFNYIVILKAIFAGVLQR